MNVWNKQHIFTAKLSIAFSNLEVQRQRDVVFRNTKIRCSHEVRTLIMPPTPQKLLPVVPHAEFIRFFTQLTFTE